MSTKTLYEITITDVDSEEVIDSLVTADDPKLIIRTIERGHTTWSDEDEYAADMEALSEDDEEEEEEEEEE